MFFVENTKFHIFREQKRVIICIFRLRPCSGGVNLENWTIFFDHLIFEKYEPVP